MQFDLRPSRKHTQCLYKNDSQDIAIVCAMYDKVSFLLGIMEVNSADGFAYEILRRCMLFASESRGTYEKQIRQKTENKKRI